MPSRITGGLQPTLIRIQDEEEYSNEIPLILIHDGGGTIRNYSRLRSLQRPVYAIPDPTFNTDQSWERGISQMAEVYSALIQKKLVAGQVLLGGWSLGAFVCLEIARTFAHQDIIDVAGIIMVDASFLAGERSKPFVGSNNLNGILKGMDVPLRTHLEKSLKDAESLVTSWTPSPWSTILPDEVVPIPVPVALLRAEECVPTGLEASAGVALVDYFRDDEWLGWSRYDDQLIKMAINMPGHHFNIFDDAHIAKTSRNIRNACIRLSDADY